MDEEDNPIFYEGTELNATSSVEEGLGLNGLWQIPDSALNEQFQAPGNSVIVSTSAYPASYNYR